MLETLPDPCTLVRVLAWSVGQQVPVEAAKALGVTWPDRTGAVARGRAAVLCVSPADWLVAAPGAERTSILGALQNAFRDSPFRATDLSAAYSRTRIQGPNAEALLAKACALDFHPDAFPVGSCARTRFANVAALIVRDAESVFECIIARSYLDYLMSWLEDAAREFSDG